jgi:TrmH family RNA methyltransferase
MGEEVADTSASISSLASSASPASGRFDLVHVVLVEPSESLNIGSVARAMSNLGFSHLHLVKPQNFDRTRAKITACWGDFLLDTVTIHDSLEQALGPMQEVVGFSGQHGKHRPQHVFLHEWESNWSNAPALTTALLFGPEDTGLTQEHLAHCRWTVRIPSTVKNPSFNLAQAVLLVLFELKRAELHGLESPPVTAADQAPMNFFYQLDRIVGEVLERCEFYREGTPGPIPDLVKNMLRRIAPDTREMGVLQALFGRLNSALKRAGYGTSVAVTLEAEGDLRKSHQDEK